MCWFFKVIDVVHNLIQICENIDGTTVIIVFRKWLVSWAVSNNYCLETFRDNYVDNRLKPYTETFSNADTRKNKFLSEIQITLGFQKQFYQFEITKKDDELVKSFFCLVFKITKIYYHYEASVSSCHRTRIYFLLKRNNVFLF